MSDGDDENLRVSCEECRGAGNFGNGRCHNCGGKGYRMRIPDAPSKRRADRPKRTPPNAK
jgi:hypothetical protein